MHFLVGTLLAALWLFASGAVLYAVIIPSWFRSNFGSITRNQKDLPLWAVAVEKLGQGLGLSLVVAWTRTDLLPLIAIPVLLVSWTYAFSTYANYRVAGKAVSVIALLDGIRLILALGIVGLIFGRSLF